MLQAVCQMRLKLQIDFRGFQRLTFRVVEILDGNSESALNGNLVLKNSCILMRCEFPFAVCFPLERERFIAELIDAILERQFVIVYAGEIFAVELPAVDELLIEIVRLFSRSLKSKLYSPLTTHPAHN